MEGNLQVSEHLGGFSSRTLAEKKVLGGDSGSSILETLGLRSSSPLGPGSVMSRECSSRNW